LANWVNGTHRQMYPLCVLVHALDIADAPHYGADQPVAAVSTVLHLFPGFQLVLEDHQDHVELVPNIFRVLV
jgi:hypothetical protein